MTLSTLPGRLQTKMATFILLAIITLPFVVVYGWPYFILFCLAVIVGLVLETIWGFILVHQPGWLTFLLGFIEFSTITAAAITLELPLSIAEAALYYLSAWIPIQLFLIYILPIWRLDWLSNGAELWEE